MVVDLFSGGGGGWCLAARALGLDAVGIESDGPACATRAAVGLRTIRADVAAYPTGPFAGVVEGLCASPPCQSFSTAGRRRGLDDERGMLVLEPLRWVRAVRPRWVALEQVPEVLIYWRSVRDTLAAYGYSAWCGVLDAADYGVPQNRRRAILLASLDRSVSPPAPSHSERGEASLLGDGLPRWVSMAEALGWGLTTRPAYTVCGSSDDGGPHDGGSRQREAIRRHMEAGRWLLRTPGRSYTAEPRVADPWTEPAPTVALGHNGAAWCWERPEETSIPIEPWELGVLQGFPPDHPWRSPYVARQIGNALPPPLAEACLRAVVAP